MSTTVLELAISLAFLYLMFSAVCSAVQELIANLLKWRADTLKKGLKAILLDPNAVQSLYQHSLIKGLCRPSSLMKENAPQCHDPSYIPSRTFALALLDLHNTAAALPQGTKNMINSLLRGVENDAQKQIERIDSSGAPASK
jgi:hypothetical protein